MTKSDFRRSTTVGYDDMSGLRCPVPSWRRDGGAAATPSVYQRRCRARSCRAVFFICRPCYSGQTYCSSWCRRTERREQLRQANRRHQQSPGGRLDHRDRQRAYRRRRAATGVTDQGRQAAHRSRKLPSCRRRVATRRPHGTRGRSVPARGRARCVSCGQVGTLVLPFGPAG